MLSGESGHRAEAVKKKFFQHTVPNLVRRADLLALLLVGGADHVFALRQRPSPDLVGDAESAVPGILVQRPEKSLCTVPAHGLLLLRMDDEPFLECVRGNEYPRADADDREIRLLDQGIRLGEADAHPGRQFLHAHGFFIHLKAFLSCGFARMGDKKNAGPQIVID